MVHGLKSEVEKLRGEKACRSCGYALITSIKHVKNLAIHQLIGLDEGFLNWFHHVLYTFVALMMSCMFGSYQTTCKSIITSNVCGPVGIALIF